MPESLRRVEVPVFDAARLRCLEYYNNVERALAELTRSLLGVTSKKGYTVFYSLTNSRSRYAIISELIKLSEYPETRPYWQYVEKKMNKLDQARNKIVHWHGVVQLSDGHTDISKLPAKFLQSGRDVFNPDPQILTISDLENFEKETGLIFFPLTLYAQLFHPQPQYELREAWLQICREPIDDQSRDKLLQLLTPKEQ